MNIFSRFTILLIIKEDQLDHDYCSITSTTVMVAKIGRIILSKFFNVFNNFVQRRMGVEVMVLSMLATPTMTKWEVLEKYNSTYFVIDSWSPADSTCWSPADTAFRNQTQPSSGPSSPRLSSCAYSDKPVTSPIPARASTLQRYHVYCLSPSQFTAGKFLFIFFLLKMALKLFNRNHQQSVVTSNLARLLGVY